MFSWCNACESCYNGNPNYCQNGGLRSTIGIFLNGGFAKFCIVPLNLVNKLPNEVSMEQGNVFSFASLSFIYYDLQCEFIWSFLKEHFASHCHVFYMVGIVFKWLMHLNQILKSSLWELVSLATFGCVFFIIMVLEMS